MKFLEPLAKLVGAVCVIGVLVVLPSGSALAERPEKESPERPLSGRSGGSKLSGTVVEINTAGRLLKIRSRVVAMTSDPIDITTVPVYEVRYEDSTFCRKAGSPKATVADLQTNDFVFVSYSRQDGRMVAAQLIWGMPEPPQRARFFAPTPDATIATSATGRLTQVATSAGQSNATLTIDLGGGVRMEFVRIDALDGWVGKYEVTNEEYRRFKPDHNSTEYMKHSLNGNRQPVVMVDYVDGVAFADWINHAAKLPEGYTCRLPTREEWFAYAQCGDGRKYPWGNEWPPKYGNYVDMTAKKTLNWKVDVDDYNDGFAVSCPVEQSGRNEWGLYGVGGNVSEWTTEQYKDVPLRRVLRGSDWFADHTQPKDLECTYAVICGVPSMRGFHEGFRLVLRR